MSSNKPEKVRSLHIGTHIQSEVFVSLKFMILDLLVVEKNAGWVCFKVVEAVEEAGSYA